MIKLNDNEINIGNFPDGTMLIKQNIPEGNLLETVFKDGKMIKDYTLNEIRQRLNGGEF